MNDMTNIQEILIPFTSDYGFKATFGNEIDTRFLRKALQALIKSDIPIKEVVFTKNEFSGITIDGRGGIFDLTCTDDKDRTFIVEMQVGEFKNFIQRMKFYAFQRFNVMVKQGRYLFDDLRPIYCVGILAHNIYKFDDYYNYGAIFNQHGQLMDDQISYVTIELEKFNLSETQITTDLEKLIFTMKNFTSYSHTTQYPQFWNEDWLQCAIQELDTRRFTPEQRLRYETILAQNAVAVYNEKKAIENAVLESKKEAIVNLLNLNLEPPVIAKVQNVTIEFVLQIKEEIDSLG
jgi:predicted transposase/invertase (TIGR01784 family)